MNKVVPAAAILILAVAVPAALAQAVQNVVLRNSFNPIGAGARGLGMGGAFIAVADDGTAASFNPAGLAQLRRTEIAAVGFGTRLDSTFTIPRLGAGSEERSTSDRHNAPEFFGLAVPFKAGGKTLTVQLSYQRTVDLYGKGLVVTQDTYRLEDLGFDLPGFASTVSDILPSQEGAFHTGSVSVAYEATKRLLVGLSANYWVGEWRAVGSTNFRIQAAPRPPQPPVELYRIETDFDQDQSLRGLNVNFGVLLRYPKFSLGAAFRLPFTGAYDLIENGQTLTTTFGEPAGDPEIRAVGAKSQLEYPQSLGVGIAVHPFTGLTLAGDFSQYRWSRMTLANIPDGALLTPTPAVDSAGNVAATQYLDRNFFDVQPASQTTTNDTKQWRAGIEYLFSLPRVVVPVRGGIYRDRSPVASVGFGEGRLIRGWTAGTGFNFSHLVFDVAFERRESEGPVGLVFRGGQLTPQENAPSEKVQEDRLVASLIYRFGPDDPIKRAFRAIFVGSGEKKDN